MDTALNMSQTCAEISPSVMDTFGGMDESRIRMIAKANGIVLEARSGNVLALLAELTRVLEGRNRGK